MNHYLSSYTSNGNRDNNFNLIRFVAASMVLFSHSFALSIGSGLAEPLRKTLDMTFGTIAVDIFFITSGFLITGSMLTKKNLVAFVWARVLRIYPALIIAMLFCVFVVGFYFTELSSYSYLSNPNILKFLLKNISLFGGVNHYLPGVFEDVPYKGTVNGSLWTLPWEIRMYTILVLLGSISFPMKRFGKILFGYTVVGIAFVSTMMYIFNNIAVFVDNDGINNTLELLSMFFMGAAFYILKGKIALSNKIIVLMCLILSFSLVERRIFFIFYNLFIAYIVFYLAYIPSGKIRNFNKFGDYSYGLYIYAFPVQQSIAALVQNISVEIMLITSFSITLIIAVLSWHLIEKKFLQMRDHYIVFEKTFSSIRLTRSLTRIQ